MAVVHGRQVVDRVAGLGAVRAVVVDVGDVGVVAEEGDDVLGGRRRPEVARHRSHQLEVRRRVDRHAELVIQVGLADDEGRRVVMRPALPERHDVLALVAGPGEEVALVHRFPRPGPRVHAERPADALDELARHPG